MNVRPIDGLCVIMVVGLPWLREIGCHLSNHERAGDLLINSPTT